MQAVRDQLGLTQQQLAEWLDLSRNVIAKWESGLTGLPTAAMIKLSELVILAEKIEKNPLPGKLASKKSSPELQNFLADCAYRLEVTKRELQALEVRENKLKKWIAILGELANTELEHRKSLWVKSESDRAKSKLAALSPFDRASLEAKIAVLQETMARASKG